MEKPIVIYTDHTINRTLCYKFAKGSDSLLCHVNNFKDYNKTIATYGVLRGTIEVIKKVENYYYMDHGYFNQSNRSFENNRTAVINLDGYFFFIEKFDIHSFFLISAIIRFLFNKKIFLFFIKINFFNNLFFISWSLVADCSITSISFILKNFILFRFRLLKVVKIKKKIYKLNIFFYLFVEAFSNIQSNKDINLILLYFAISGTSESFVIPG